jgi:hypothetical protein
VKLKRGLFLLGLSILPVLLLMCTLGGNNGTDQQIQAISPESALPPSTRSLNALNPNPPSEPVRLVFVHHSVGDDWLGTDMGGLGDQLGANNYYVSDTYYDWGPDDIGSYTDIGNWWEWFRGPSSTTYMQALYPTTNQHASYTRPMANPGGENEIVMFKSCYPNSHLGGSPTDLPTTGDNPLRGEDYTSPYHTVANAKGIYNDILEYFSTRQDKLFVVITAPPMYAPNTDAAHAANARALNTWLVNDWLATYPHNNVAVFDFYNVLTSNGGSWDVHDLNAETGNHHRYRNGVIEYITDQGSNTSAYPEGGIDDHPSAAGGQKATGEFVSLLNIYYNNWRSGGTIPVPNPTEPASQAGQIYLPLVTMGAPSPPTPQPTGDCPLYSAEATFMTGTSVHAVPDFAEYPTRQWFIDPTFNTCVVRVTDRIGDLSPDDDSTGMANEYARVDSFNADGSRMLVRGTEGTWYLYNAQTLQPLAQLPLEVEPRWDASDPNIIYHMADTRLLYYNVQTGQGDEIRDFSNDIADPNLVAVWTRHEGSPSRDSRYWGLMAQLEQAGDWVTSDFLVYDRSTDQVVIRNVSGLPGVSDGIDHVTISPLGNYYIASFDRYCDHGELGTDFNPCGMMVYDSDLTNGRGLLLTIGHYDPALDAQGREVVIYQGIDTDRIDMLDLETGTVTPLWDIDFSHTGIGFHFSGLGYDVPGWAVVSTHDDDPIIHTWMDDQVFLVELKANGRVVRLTHTHSIVDESQPFEYHYWAEPHASTNSDITRIVFTTNWGRYDSAGVEMYMIALPQDWPERLE